jgi:putative ABC transport system ATP-binding protein
MTTPGDCLAALIDVSRTFGSAGHETVALKNASLEVRAGELVLLLGPSGSGKTTLLTIIAGLQRPTSGRVMLFGRPLGAYSAREMQRLRASSIGFIFQTFHLLESLSVLENVTLVARFAGVRRAEARRRAMDLLDRFGVDRLAGSSPRTLSQGEKQRVAVARALVNGAELILADEPTGSLATQQGFEVVRMIRDCVKNEGRCAVVVSHDERIAEFSDRVLHLRDGSLSID